MFSILTTEHVTDDSKAGDLAVQGLAPRLVQQGAVRGVEPISFEGEQLKQGTGLSSILAQRHRPSSPDMARAQGEVLGFQMVDLDHFEIDVKTSARLPEQQARRWRALLLKEDKGVCLVGFVDPLDLRAQDRLSAQLKRPLDVAVITAEHFHQSFDRIYRKTEQIDQFAREVEQEVSEGHQVFDLPNLGRALDDTDAPVVKLLQTLFEDAARVNASDIHIEPQEHQLVVRFRIDGVLRVQVQSQRAVAPLLLVRLKLMAGLDIAERRLPQDGRIAVRTTTTQFDVRMSTMPVQHGESVVLRLLRQDTVGKSLRHMMAPDVCDVMERVIRSPHGIVLVTGPTGSGKSTTLYSALEELNDPGVKILTVEDPVEYRMNGINQVQINEKIELTFSRVLRSFLRQDPDVILVGEIRDGETAEIAVRAAMTGHMVLSTLHTNDAKSAPLRLIDMGVPNYMIASALLAVVSQRLIRLVCVHCAEPVALTQDKRVWLETYLSPEEVETATLRHGRGCPRCNGVGYSGRRAVHEVLEITPALAETMQQSNPAAFERAAEAQIGARTLAHSALKLVIQGKTTLAEAMTVIEKAV
jgi:MSHA biogenesis protein MshE